MIPWDGQKSPGWEVSGAEGRDQRQGAEWAGATREDCLEEEMELGIK